MHIAKAPAYTNRVYPTDIGYTDISADLKQARDQMEDAKLALSLARENMRSAQATMADAIMKHPAVLRSLLESSPSLLERVSRQIGE